MNSRVEMIDGDGVVVNGERIAAATVLWAAGVVASPEAGASSRRLIGDPPEDAVAGAVRRD